jgi:shikimate kinase
MVKIMNMVLTDSTPMRRRPLIVELAGPAGAGKTTLAQTLSQRSKKIRTDSAPYFRKIEDIAFYARNTLGLMPTFFHLYRNMKGRWLTREEIVWMAILKGWHQVLRQNRSRKDAVVLLDQGPVFLLARLYAPGPESLKIQGTEKWWDGAINRWSSTLDAVVWLDASDTILVERIRTRNKWHLVKEKPEQEVFEFLAHYRTSYEYVISMLASNNGCLKILRYDTARESLDEIVNRILAVFGLENSEHIVAC